MFPAPPDPHYPPDAVARLLAAISIEGVQKAREVIAPHLARTPLLRHPLLVEATGLDLHVKHENHLPTGAFKIRGGINFMTALPALARRRGVVTATRGNHGQSIALGAALFGVRCVVVVPLGNNPDKNAAMRAYGAESIEHGRDFDEARELAREMEQSEGLTFIHNANEPELIHGVGTYFLEILEDLPEIDAVVIPIGGGSAICAAMTVFRALKPSVRIIGVQAEGAPCVYESWRRKERVSTPGASTFADGIATRVPFELPFAMIGGVDDIVLVSEDEIRAAVKMLLSTTRNLAEGAGAAPLAAAIKLHASLRAQKTAIILSGGNMDVATLRDILR